jgi:Spy/CpxP family protein refolding chaperone
MLRAVLAAGVLCVVAAGCASNHPAAAPAKTVTAAPSPSMSWDLLGQRACQSAAKGEDLTAEADAKISKMPELSALSGYPAVKAWCAENYHG